MIIGLPCVFFDELPTHVLYLFLYWIVCLYSHSCTLKLILFQLRVTNISGSVAHLFILFMTPFDEKQFLILVQNLSDFSFLV